MTPPAAAPSGMQALPRAPRRVAVFARLWEPGLGDLVQRNIFLALLRRAYPDAELVHVVGETALDRFAEFFAHHSYADRVEPCPDYRDDGPGSWAPFYAGAKAAAYELCVVDPDSRGLAGEQAARCGIGATLGFTTGYDDYRYLTHPIRLPRPIFGAPDLYDYANGLAGALGLGRLRPSEVVPPFPVQPEPVPTLPRPTVAVHPGGAPHWNRRWPLDRYAELVRGLPQARSFVLIGSSGERPELSILRDAAQAPVELSCGDSLNRLATLLRDVDVLVGGDSAPAHLASSYGRPTVVLYGPTTTEFMWARAYPNHHGINRRYPCQRIRNLERGPGTQTMPCPHSCHYPYAGPAGPYPRCLTDITLDEVRTAITAQLPRPAFRPR